MNKQHTYQKIVINTIKVTLTVLMIFCIHKVNATNYTVNTKSNLQTKMAAALPGDTVIVTNGIYNNWGTINFTNNNGTTTSAWIVLKAQTLAGVVFTGNTAMQFAGKRILVTGFKFANGNTGQLDVIQFRNSSSVAASYCRITNIIIDDYNSDSTGSYLNNSTDIGNKWVSIYGIRNRVDHCTFINKFNDGATVVVWYDNNTYTTPSTSTYHTIDSNYFNGRGYLGDNGGETIRVGTSSNSRTNGFNVIEYNLFENCVQLEPEIVSNKSNFNSYRYNTFKNCNGGLTLRHGRYCNVYGNFFIVDNPARVYSYGIRVIDKGHKIYNNYIEGVLGNKNKLTSLRCPIILYNGLSSINDTTDASKAAGYFPTDSVVVAFNTIVNCTGGAGIVLGFTDGGSNVFQPKGVQVANNLVKMTTGQAAYIDPLNTTLTYNAEGNFYNAPSFGLSSSTGFTSKSLTFGTRTNGTLPPPSLVQDAATNSAAYSALLNYLDANGKTRTALFDVGCQELNGTANIIASPLDSNQVGAGKPVVIVPVHLINFSASSANNQIKLQWNVENEISFLQYEIEYSFNGIDFMKAATIKALQQSIYTYFIASNRNSKNYFRLKLVDKDGKFTYSNIVSIDNKTGVNIYPNPANDFINIDLNNHYNHSTIRVVDAYGKNIKQLQVNANHISISTKEFSNGIYAIQIIENNQVVNTYSIVVAK